MTDDSMPSNVILVEFRSTHNVVFLGCRSRYASILDASGSIDRAGALLRNHTRVAACRGGGGGHVSGDRQGVKAKVIYGEWR